MKTLAGAEVKIHLFSFPVIVPIEKYNRIKTRKLGTLKGKINVNFPRSWTLTDEEFLTS